MSWETLEEILTSSVGFVIAMVVLSAIIGVGLYGYWVYVNHQTLENYLWPVAEVVPLRNGSYFLGVVNTGNEPIIIEDIYTNNSKVLSVNSKPLSHNQWLFETLSSLPVAVRVCSALDPKVCEVVPVHGWGYARLFSGVWVTFIGNPWPGCAWKLIWYGGNGGMIQSSQSLSWFIPTNETIYFHADAIITDSCTGATISGPSSAEPGQNVTFSIMCYDICGSSGGGGGGGGGSGNGGGGGNNTSSTCSVSLSPVGITITSPGNYTISFTASLTGNNCPTGGSWFWIGYTNMYGVVYEYGNGQTIGQWATIDISPGLNCNGDSNGWQQGPGGSYTITCTNSTS
jgi:hypothetical protein